MTLAIEVLPPRPMPGLPGLPPGDWPAQGLWTYEDYLRLPQVEGRRYEVISGVLYMANTPEIIHQDAVTEIGTQLRTFVRQHRLGTLLVAPVEVRLGDLADPVQPDVLFVRADRRGIITRQYVDGAPDLVVEVLSPGTWRFDRMLKLAAYERAGVSEYWIVNPKTRSVEVNVLEGEEYELLGEFGPGEEVQSRVLPDLTVTSDAFFAE